MNNDLSKILRMRKLKVELDLEEDRSKENGPPSRQPGEISLPLSIDNSHMEHCLLQPRG